MGVTNWLGVDLGNEGKWDTAANWDNGVPSAANSAQFLSGSQNVTGDLTPAASTILGIYVAPEYTGNIGFLTEFLVLSDITDHIDIQGGNQAHIQTGQDATAGVHVRNAVIGGTLHLKTGTGGGPDMDRLKIELGYVIHHSGTITQVIMDWRNNIVTDSRLKVPVGGGTIDALEMDGGSLRQEGGTITACIASKASLAIEDGTMLVLTTYGSSTLWHTVTAGTAHVHGGVFDASGDGRAKTITALSLHSDASINLDNGRGNITVSLFRREGEGDYKLSA